jgi:hypothetical protein
MTFRLRSDGQKTVGGVPFVAKLGFSSGLLPTQKEVLEVFLFHLLPAQGRFQLSRTAVADIVACGLMEHWVVQNVYTITKSYIVKKILRLYEEFFALKNVSKQKQTPSWKQSKLQPFLDRIDSCMDISCKDKVALRKLESFYGVKMTEVEEKFLADQLGPRLMLCTTEVDRLTQQVN